MMLPEPETEAEHREIPQEIPDPAAADSSTGSGESPAADLTCPYCGRPAKAERFLNIHIAKKHPGRPKVSYQDAPQREAPPIGPTVVIPPKIDLEELEKVTARNIQAVGQLMHGGLQMAKLGKMVNPESRLPALDTHLAIALQLRAEATAHLLVGYAEKNDGVMKAVQAFNRAFEGGESATVIISLGLAAAATIGAPAPGFLQTMVNGDVVSAVQKENVELFEQATKIRQAQAAAKEAA